MIIKDKLIAPYEIHTDGTQYTVGKPYLVVKTNETVLQNASYFITLNNALEKIVKLKMSDKEETFTIREYINEYETIRKTFLDNITV